MSNTIPLPKLPRLPDGWWKDKVTEAQMEHFIHAHAAAVSADKDAEIAELKLLLRLALPHVQYGASRYYDGTNGIARRNEASDLVGRIHAARAALGDKTP